MNYMEHNKELHGSLFKTETPVIFTKADSALLSGGKPFFIPHYTQQCEYETELVVRISHLGRSIPQRFAHRYYNEITVGIDFTARDLQRQLTAKGLPWDLCKGFDGSAAVGKFINKEDLGCDVQDIHFHMNLNGERKQTGHTADMIHSIDHIIAHASRYFTLKTGDLIFTGTPVGVGPVKEGDKIEAYIGEQKLLDLRIR